MPDLLDIPGNEVTRESVAHLPDAPRDTEEDAVGIGPLSAHVAILSRKRTPEGYAEFQLRQALDDALAELGRERVNQIVREAAE